MFGYKKEMVEKSVKILFFIVWFEAKGKIHAFSGH